MIRHLTFGLALLGSITIAPSAHALTEVGDRLAGTAEYSLRGASHEWSGQFVQVRAESGDTISGYCEPLVAQNPSLFPGENADEQERHCGRIILEVNSKLFPETIRSPEDLWLHRYEDHVYAFPSAPRAAGGGEADVVMTAATMTDEDFAVLRNSVNLKVADLAAELDGLTDKLTSDIESLRSSEAASKAAVNERMGRFQDRFEALARKVGDDGPILRMLSTLQANVAAIQDRGPAIVDPEQLRSEMNEYLGDLPAEVQALRIEVAALDGRVTELRDRVSGVDDRVGVQGEQLAAQEQRLTDLDAEVGDVTATANDALAQVGDAQADVDGLRFELDEVADTADRALEQVGGLTAEGGVIALLREDVAKLTADDGPLEGLRGEINALTEDGGRLAVVEDKLSALTADGEPIESLQALLDALVVDGGIIDQAVNNAMAAYEERLARAENPFRSALVTVYPPAADWSSARQTMALALVAATALLVLVIMTVLVARFVTRKQRAQAKANDRTLHGYTEKLGSLWARLRGKAQVIYHQGLKETVADHEDQLSHVKDRLDDPETGLLALNAKVVEAQETASAAQTAHSRLKAVKTPDLSCLSVGDTEQWILEDDHWVYSVDFTRQANGTFETNILRDPGRQHEFITDLGFKSVVRLMNRLHAYDRRQLHQCRVAEKTDNSSQSTTSPETAEPEPA